jgi:hypothetical protein
MECSNGDESMRILMIAAAATLAAVACSPEDSSTAESPAQAAGPTATDTAGAEAFLRQALAMYTSPAAYAAAERDEAALAERGTPAQVQRLFTPRLADMLNRAYATEGGLGADPICMCQDDTGMVIRSIQSAPQADDRVQSTVAFGGTGVLIYTLEQTPAGWRIADVVDRGRAGNEGDVGLVQTLSQQ